VRRRIAAAAVLAIGLMLALVGCTFFAPQATLIPYDASDGVSLNVGVIQLRNAFVISPDGETANFVGVLINTSKSAQDVKLQYVSHVNNTTARTTVDVRMTAGDVISYGNPGVPQLIMNAINVQPGGLLTVFVQYDGVSGKNVRIPVLNGQDPTYGHLQPTPTPTPNPMICSTAAAGKGIGCPNPTASGAPSN
jgi:hypothetical protein